MKRRGINETYFLNLKTQTHYSTLLKLIATNCHKWVGLPETIPEYFIENGLYENGIMAFAKDNVLGFICAKCTPTTNLNIYGEPLGYRLYGTGYSKVYKKEDIVIIRNNKDEVPTINLIDFYLKKLYEIDRAIDTNIMHQKISKIITCDEEKRLTVENLLMKHESNVPYILGFKGIEEIKIDTLDLTSPFVGDVLMELKKEIFNECLEMLGINNANTNKRERLITDEVNANNEILQISKDIFMEGRQKACEDMHQKFGIKMSVERRDNVGTIHSGIGKTD